jgi:hypothetical protein
MNLDEVRTKRREIELLVKRCGGVHVRVVIPGPADVDVYFLITFADEARARLRDLDYFAALDELERDLRRLLACRVGVGDADGESANAAFDERARRTAVDL